MWWFLIQYYNLEYNIFYCNIKDAHRGYNMMFVQWLKVYFFYPFLVIPVLHPSLFYQCVIIYLYCAALCDALYRYRLVGFVNTAHSSFPHPLLTVQYTHTYTHFSSGSQRKSMRRRPVGDRKCVGGGGVGYNAIWIIYTVGMQGGRSTGEDDARCL